MAKSYGKINTNVEVSKQTKHGRLTIRKNGK